MSECDVETTVPMYCNTSVLIKQQIQCETGTGRSKKIVI